VADRSGLEALSMRRTAAELGAGVMSLYRHVPDKDALLDLVVDAIFAEHPLPEPGPDGWRAKLELSARCEWEIYQAHPWLAPVVAGTTRPPIAAALMGYTEWRMHAIEDRGLDVPVRLQVAVAISTAVQGAALALARESSVRRDAAAWFASRHAAIGAALASAPLPLVSRFGAAEFRAVAPQAVFDFTVRCTLDGIGVLLGDH
jgi:AcrR family transcriptional regulator